jgi:hypothetical protein
MATPRHEVPVKEFVRGEILERGAGLILRFIVLTKTDKLLGS